MINHFDIFFPIYLYFKAVNIWEKVCAQAERLNPAFLQSPSGTQNTTEK